MLEKGGDKRRESPRSGPKKSFESKDFFRQQSYSMREKIRKQIEEEMKKADSPLRQMMDEGIHSIGKKNQFDAIRKRYNEYFKQHKEDNSLVFSDKEGWKNISLKQIIKPGIREVVFIPKGQSNPCLLVRREDGHFVPSNDEKYPLPARNLYKGRIAIYPDDGIKFLTISSGNVLKRKPKIVVGGITVEHVPDEPKPQSVDFELKEEVVYPETREAMEKVSLSGLRAAVAFWIDSYQENPNKYYPLLLTARDVFCARLLVEKKISIRTANPVFYAGLEGIKKFFYEQIFPNSEEKDMLTRSQELEDSLGKSLKTKELPQEKLHKLSLRSLAYLSRQMFAFWGSVKNLSVAEKAILLKNARAIITAQVPKFSENPLNYLKQNYPKYSDMLEEKNIKRVLWFLAFFSRGLMDEYQYQELWNLQKFLEKI